MPAGRIRIGDLEVFRLGFGAMRITGEIVWGPPQEGERARRSMRSLTCSGARR